MKSVTLWSRVIFTTLYTNKAFKTSGMIFNITFLIILIIFYLFPTLKNYGSNFFSFFFFFLFRASPRSYGRSQARGQIRAVAAGLHHSHSNMRSKLHLRPVPQPMAMPGITPISSWILVGFITSEPQQEPLIFLNCFRILI